MTTPFAPGHPLDLGMALPPGLGVALPHGLGLALRPELGLGLWLAFGLTGGAVHFALLRWNAMLYLADGGLGRALLVQVFRMAAVALLLGFAAWHGVLPLLVTTIGVFLARVLVLRVMAAP
jgi:N-ATPase, AtpR subunit